MTAAYAPSLNQHRVKGENIASFEQLAAWGRDVEAAIREPIAGRNPIDQAGEIALSFRVLRPRQLSSGLSIQSENIIVEENNIPQNTREVSYRSTRFVDSDIRF